MSVCGSMCTAATVKPLAGVGSERSNVHANAWASSSRLSKAVP